MCHALVSRVNKKCQAQNFLLKKLLIVISQSVPFTPDMKQFCGYLILYTPKI
jgi:hypothetical protein